MQVFAKCDDFIEGLCKRLNIEIPPFTLYRRAKVSTQQGEGSEVKVTVTGLDTNEKDLPYSFIKVRFGVGGQSTEPYMIAHGSSRIAFADYISSAGCSYQIWRRIYRSRGRAIGVDVTWQQ